MKVFYRLIKNGKWKEADHLEVRVEFTRYDGTRGHLELDLSPFVE